MQLSALIHSLSTEKRVQVLSSIADLGLRIFGTESWANGYYYSWRINAAYDSRRITTLEDNQDVYNQSKIGISVSHVQAQVGFPWRVLDIMASNALLITDYHQDFDVLFPKGLLPTFENPGDARNVCVQYLNDESARRDIVNRCNEIIEKQYRFSHFFFNECKKR